MAFLFFCSLFLFSPAASSDGAARVTMKTITTTIANKHAKRKVEDEVAYQERQRETESLIKGERGSFSSLSWSHSQNQLRRVVGGRRRRGKRKRERENENRNGNGGARTRMKCFLINFALCARSGTARRDAAAQMGRDRRRRQAARGVWHSKAANGWE